MIGNLDDLGPWATNEDARYTDRMAFEDAWDFAADHCEECVAATRPTEETP